MIIKVRLDKNRQLLMPDAIICHHVSQDRGCLSSNIMGILWGTFKLKGLGAREGFLPPCVVLWE